ncbi:uncharacterized protein PV09_06273 [Verruconis gallopava]|uniref:Uncharacterized protein n=1 Tax=Verruconis gallopava TaxID=253628 RepID=A0A0D2A7E3_9PEZI|nr:uncharacterized protein PV09_06273 [Verruconis gallopava]KIW02465.1 hypothetical protein PV09_06273 [Verruconis gallopava]
MTTWSNEDLPPAFEDVVDVSAVITLPPLDGSDDNDDLAFRTESITQNDPTISTTRTLLDEEVDDAEEPPGYGQETGLPQLPGYAERHLLEPVVAYNVYQINRRLQVLTPATRATFSRPRYRVTARLGPAMFSKKADFTLTRLPTGIAAATENSPGKDVGFARFDRAGQLPWMPRATVELVCGDVSGSNKLTYDLYAPNFADWRFRINNELYYWHLTDRPIALSLMENSSNSVVARFTYSKLGTDANRGAEVGTFSIFGGHRSGDTETVELVLSSWIIAVNHWKNMGRHYRNSDAAPTTTVRNFSTVGPVGMGSSFFARDGRSSGPRRASNIV